MANPLTGLNLGLHLFRDILLLTLTQPLKRGFFCIDESIRYPLKQQSLSIGRLITLTSLFTFGTIIIFERPATRSSNKIASYLRQVYTSSVTFIFGYLSILILVAIVKVRIGSLRPNFIEACQPYIQASAVNDPFLALNITSYCRNADKYRYISLYTCQIDESDSQELNSYRTSAMSYFASTSSYVATFLILYIQQSPGKTGLWKPTLQFLIVIFAFCFSMSRVYDYYNRESEVIFSSICGIAFGTFIFFFVLTQMRKLYGYVPSYNEEDKLLLVSDSHARIQSRELELPKVVSFNDKQHNQSKSFPTISRQSYNSAVSGDIDSDYFASTSIQKPRRESKTPTTSIHCVNV